MKFIIDENLPRKVNVWNGDIFLHVTDVNFLDNDAAIWLYAKENSITIVTKDTDFHERIIHSNPPPKIILFRTGNMLLKEFDAFVAQHWKEIELKTLNSKLVVVYNERIEFMK